MYWRISLCVMSIVMSAGVGRAQSPTTKLAPQKGWLADLPTAMAAAQKSGKPLMVVFRCDP